MLAGGPKAESIRKDIDNEFVKGYDNYPTDMTAVCKYIVNYKATDIAPVVAAKPAPIESLTFAQLQTPHEGRQAPDIRTVTCHNPKCGQLGHYANSPECPIRQQKMANAAKYEELMSKKKEVSSADKPVEEKATSKAASGKRKVNGASFLMMGLEDGAFDDEPMDRTHSMFCQLGSEVNAIDAAIADPSAAGQREKTRSLEPQGRPSR